MLGRRPVTAPAAGKKRKWEEGDSESNDGQDGDGAEPSVGEMEDWREREKHAEGGQGLHSAPPPGLTRPSFVQSSGPSSDRMQSSGPSSDMHGPAGHDAAGGMLPGMGPPGMMSPGMMPPGMPLGMQPMGMMPLMVRQDIPPPRTGPGLRLGEGDDRNRSRDEIRIIKEMLAEEINQFIVQNRVDGPAARDLRVEPVHVQLAVLDRGPLTRCSNPSGALIGRIRDAKKVVRQPGGAPATIHQSIQLPLGQSGPPVPMGGAQPPPPMMPPPAGIGGQLALPMPGMGGDLERFIAENKLDQGAATSLRSETREVQDKVVAMGPLVNAINPSAALMGRIRSVRAGVTNYQGGMAVLGAAPQPMSMPSVGALPAGQPFGGGPFGGGCGCAGACGGSIQDRAMSNEAMKAIRSIQDFASRAPETREPMHMQQAPARPHEQLSAQPQPNLTIEDSRLQAEALKAIQAINMAEL